MKIGVIGLGSIAQKAYLPVITVRKDIDLVLCTRNKGVLKELSQKYRILNTAQNIDELINSGIDAAFIHSSTESHVDIAERLINNNIHVYVDKPIAYSLEEAQKLVSLAESRGITLMTGFNRRFAPMYRDLKKCENPNLIIMQKNRTFIPDVSRAFIFDDFVHVVDTLRYLLPEEIEDMSVNYLKKNGLLHSVALRLCSGECTAIGIMNRDSGITEERLEVITPGNKWVVENLNETTHFTRGEERILRFNDWDTVLFRRGFPQIIDHFITSIREGKSPSPSAEDSLKTHEVLEKIVKIIENS